MAETKVDTDASFGDVMKVQVQLGGERSTLSFGVLDEGYSTEGKDGLGWVIVELWLRSMEGNVRSCSRMSSGGGAREIDTVGTVPIEVED